MPDEVNPKLRAAVGWWRALQPDPANPDPRGRSGDRAALARLRRCTRIEQAGAEPAALALARALGVTHGADRDLGDALLAAIVLAHARTDDRSLSLGRQLGQAQDADRALLSPLRLSRLLSAETFDERLTSLRRLVALLGNSANLRDLARLLLVWTEATRIALVFDYHNVPQPGADLADAAPANLVTGDPE